MPVRANVSVYACAEQLSSKERNSTTKLILAALSPQFSSPVRSDRSSVKCYSKVCSCSSQVLLSNRLVSEKRFENPK